MDQPMSATPESEGFAIRLLAEIRDDVRELTRVLRGHGEEVGLVAKVRRNEEHIGELLADKDARSKLRILSDGKTEAKWKAVAVWGAVALILIGALLDAYRALSGGSP